MRRFKKMSMTGQVNFTMVASIAAVVGIQIAMVVSLLLYNQSISRQYLDKLAQTLTANIEEMADAVNQTAYAFSFSSITNAFMQTEDLPTRYSLHKPLRELARLTCEHSPIIDTIFLTKSDGDYYTFQQDLSFPILTILADPAYLEDKAGARSSFYLLSDAKGAVSCFVFTVPIFGKEPQFRFNDIIGYASFVGNTNYLSKLLSSTDASIEFELEDSFGGVFRSNGIGKEEQRQPTFVASKTMANHGLTLNVVLERTSVDGMISVMFAFILITLLCMILLLFFIGVILKKNITEPVNELVCQLQSIKTSSFHKMHVRESGMELHLLSESINDVLLSNENMTRNMLGTQARLYELEINQKNAQFLALQSQINPHFLYNTLQCIRGLALESQQRDIAFIATAMAELFRYTIKGEPIVCIRQEVAIIKKYLRILNIRWKGRITCLYDLDEAALEGKIPKLCLQPLIENAVYHGLEMKSEDAILRFTVRKASHGYLHISIADNGSGIQPDKLEQLQARLKMLEQQGDRVCGSIPDSDSLGIANILLRLKNMHTDNGLEIFSDSSGTTVEIRLIQ